MHHPGPLVADGVVAAAVPGASAALDHVAAADVPAHAFLRTAWYTAAAGDAPITTLVLNRPGSADPVAAIPLVVRRVGPASLLEVGGSYWPWRSFPLASDCGDAELVALLASPEARAILGRFWRLGPVLADDPTVLRLAAAARSSGWTLLTRRLGACYVVDLAGLKTAGPWPAAKTLRKNRWLERRLAESGELAFSSATGSQWTEEVFDRLARIEAESWVGRKTDRRDTKFLDAGNRAMWSRAVQDPAIAAMLRVSMLHVGGDPAAFTFSLGTGTTMHVIANSYSERFRDSSPGRILLYRELQQAVETGVETIGWGAGDPGYKSHMGAKPGPDIVDLLVVRGKLAAALAGPLWRRSARQA